ncbi:MAG: 2-oxoacid:acceptor oxidoreductase family protein [Candidatus Bathyarchaeia archaeon]
MPKRIEVIIGGHGGQGVVLAGQILGKAAAFEGKNVVQTQSYGAEARGSLAKSEVIISESRIGFPAVRRCDVLVAMNQESLEKYWPLLKDDGTLIVDSSVEKFPEVKAKTFKVPAVETARKTFGENLFANMVILGALVKITQVVSVESMEMSIRESVSEKTLETNLNAFKKGLQLV